MQYWDIVLRSFQITWRHRYLWLLAFFAGESGAGFSFNYRTSAPFQPGPGGRNTPGSISAVQQQAGDWLAAHIGLVAAIVVVSLLVAIGLFILAAICEGALVRGSAEHDAERPFRLGWAWRTGISSMGAIIRFRLLLILLGLPAFVLLTAVVIGFVAAIVNHNAGAAVGVGVIGLLILLLVIVYVIYLSFLDRLGTRAIVLEQTMARAGLVRGHRLLVKRLGRVLLVWLLSIGVGIVLGVATFIVIGILSVPAIVAGIAAFATRSALAWVILAIAGVIVLAVAFVIQGFVAAQASTYWTLAFRRLDLEAAAAGYPPPPQPAQGVA